MLKRLTIENFRGYECLETPELTRFNIVGGVNDVGKTSFLEAVFLLSGLVRSDIATFLNRGRGMGVTKGGDLLSIFFGMDIRRTVKVRGDFEGGVALEVKLKGKSADEREFREYVENNGDGDARLSPALVQSFRLMKEERVVEVGDLPLLVDGKGKIRKYARMGMLHRWPCIYIPPRKSLTGIRYLKELVNRKRKKALLAVLRAVDPGICDLTVNGDRVMVDVGLPESLLPLQALGDGLVRTVDILAAADACRAGTLCIDEIENGLHHTAMRTFWRALLQFAHEGDVQVIASTHNLELMQSIAKETAEDDNGDLTYIRLVRRRDGDIVAAKLRGASYKAQLEEGVELR